MVEPAQAVTEAATEAATGAARPAGPQVRRVDPASLPESIIRMTGAQPRPRTASTSHLSARELAAVPRRNAEDALGLVPGFLLVQHGSEGKGHQFFLRGFDAIHGADLALAVDGVPVNEWSNIHAQGYIDLGFVIPEVIESVEVIKGPFTLDQGAFAMAGSASYQLGVPAGDRGVRGTYTAGSTNRHRGVVTYSPRAGDGRDFVAAEALHDGGFGQNRGIERGAVLGRVRLLGSAARGTLSLLGAGYVARFELPGTLRHQDVEAGRIGFYDAYDRDGRGLSGRGLAALSYELRGPGHALRALAYGGFRRLALLENYTGFLVDPVHGDRRAQRQDAWSAGAQLGHERWLRDSLMIEAGLGVRGDVLDQAQEHVDQQEATLARERSLDGMQALAHARAGLRWLPDDAVRLAAGVRVDVAHVAVRDRLDLGPGDADAGGAGTEGTGTRAAVLPRVVAEWRAATRWRLFAAYGRGYRPPEARAFTSFEPGPGGIGEEVYTGGDPAMTVSDAVELGTHWRPYPRLGARLSGFATRMERESIFDHVSGVNLELNSTRRLGAELEVHGNPLAWLTLSADATWVDARFVGSGNAIPLAPRLVGGVRAIVSHHSGLRAGLRFLGVAPRPLPHGARGAPLTALDLTAGFHGRRLRIDLEVENLLDQRVREGEYHYASHWRPGEPASELPVIHYVAGPPLDARLSVTAMF